MTIRLADLLIQVDGVSDGIRSMLTPYQATGEADFDVCLSEADIALERQRSEQPLYDFEYESLALYRKICTKAVNYSAFLFHCSALALDGEAYLFAAPSKTGKSTHARMWRQAFPGRIVMVNDDKPLLRFTEGGFYVYGTPWDGKHHLSTNTKARVKAICFLRQSKTNEIHCVSGGEVYVDLLNQLYRPTQTEAMRQILALADCILEQVPIYRMNCTISQEAALMAYDGMKGNERI